MCVCASIIQLSTSLMCDKKRPRQYKVPKPDDNTIWNDLVLTFSSPAFVSLYDRLCFAAFLFYWRVYSDKWQLEGFKRKTNAMTQTKRETRQGCMHREYKQRAWNKQKIKYWGDLTWGYSSLYICIVTWCIQLMTLQSLWRTQGYEIYNVQLYSSCDLHSIAKTFFYTSSVASLF